MKQIFIALAAAGAVATIAAPVLAGPVSGAIIGTGRVAVVAGPPGAVGGAVVQANTDQAVQPQIQYVPTYVSTEPMTGLIEGTARYEHGPMGLGDDVSTVGFARKF